MALSAGEVSFLVVVNKRGIVRLEEAPGTEGNVSSITAEQKQAYSQSTYGCRPVETIYETQQNPCFIIIGNFKVQVPCS